jgi:ketosteroid isomerase-like protein
MSGTATEVVNRFYEAYGAGDYEALTSLMSPDIEWLMPSSVPYGGRFEGPDAVLQYLHNLSNYVEKGTLEVLEMLDSGEHLVVTGIWRSRAKSGGEFETRFANVFRIAEGRIASLHGNHDTATVLAAFKKADV